MPAESHEQPVQDPQGHEDRVPDSKQMPEAAKRALAEAEARRLAQPAIEQQQSKEIGGRGGLNPVRYDDWETGGLASDF